MYNAKSGGDIMENAMKTIKTHVDKIGADKVGYIGSVLLLIGVFLPAITVTLRGNSESESLWYAGQIAWFIIVPAILIAALIYLKKPTKFTFLFTGFCAGLIATFLIAQREVADLFVGDVSLRWGIGIYIMILGVIACLAYGLFGEEKKDA